MVVFAMYLIDGKTSKKTKKTIVTVCPGSSDPSEKIFNMFAPENEVCTSY